MSVVFIIVGERWFAPKSDADRATLRKLGSSLPRVSIGRLEDLTSRASEVGIEIRNVTPSREEKERIDHFIQ